MVSQVRRGKGLKMRWRARSLRFGVVGLSTLVVAYVLAVDGFPSKPWLTWAGHPAAKSPQLVRAGRKPEFGSGPLAIPPPRPAGNDSSVFATPQPLLLSATQRGRNARDGLALIGVNSGSPQTYRAGALLANGAKLEEIYDQYVVLSRDGNSARLYLSTVNRAKEATAISELTFVGGTSSSALVIASTQDELTDYIRPSPVFGDSGLRGYQLFAARDPEVFLKLGLQNGDTVTSIDGAPVTEPAAALAALESLTTGAYVTVIVERNGSTQTVYLDGSIVTAAIEHPPQILADRSMNHASVFVRALASKN